MLSCKLCFTAEDSELPAVLDWRGVDTPWKASRSKDQDMRKLMKEMYTTHGLNSIILFVLQESAEALDKRQEWCSRFCSKRGMGEE